MMAWLVAGHKGCHAQKGKGGRVGQKVMFRGIKANNMSFNPLLHANSRFLKHALPTYHGKSSLPKPVCYLE